MITGGMWRPGARPSWRPGGSARPSTRGCWRSRSGGRRSSGRWPGQVVSRLSSSFCLHLLPQTKYVSLSRLSPADCLILGAFCRICGHFFDLYCKCFASLFTLTLLPFDITFNVHHRYRQHVLLHVYMLLTFACFTGKRWRNRNFLNGKIVERLSWSSTGAEHKRRRYLGEY